MFHFLSIIIIMFDHHLMKIIRKTWHFLGTNLSIVFQQ